MSLKIRIFYNLESKSNKDNTKLLYFNMSYGYTEFDVFAKKRKHKNLRLSTKYSILNEYWDKTNNRANSVYVKIHGADINYDLGEIEKSAKFHLKQYYHEHEQRPTPEYLKKKVFIDIKREKKESNDISITEYINKVITKRTSLPLGTKGHWLEKTKDQYTNVINQLEVYEKATKTRLSFGQITEEIYWNIFKVINEYYFAENEVYLTKTTIAKLCKHLKVVFNSAMEDNIDIGFNHRKRSLKIHPAPPSYETYLTPEQLLTIIKTDVSGSEEFKHAKNYLLISSFTGLRIEDMIHINELKIETKTKNGIKYDFFITKIRKAKDKGIPLEVAIPILQPVRDLLDKNDNRFPKFPSQPNIRKNIKRFMKYLDFRDEVKVLIHYYDQPIGQPIFKPQYDIFTPHDCRSTFITNLREIAMSDSIVEPITHPKVTKSVFKSYDKSSEIEKMMLFVNELNKMESEFYRY